MNQSGPWRDRGFSESAWLSAILTPARAPWSLGSNWHRQDRYRWGYNHTLERDKTRRSEWKCFIEPLGGDSAHPARRKCPCSLYFRKPFGFSHPFRRGGDRRSMLANHVRRPNGWSDAATPRHTGHRGTGGAGGAGELGHPRPGNDYLVAATRLPVSVSGAA